jgi:arylsulfatase A-like enzyme
MPVATVDLRRLALRPEPPDAVELRYVRDRYLENVAYADHLLGRVLSLLDQQGRYRETLVVLLSDHGEAFHEHGQFMHRLNVHREALHVPLIVKWPASVRGFRPEVTQPVSLVDLVPTLVDGLSLGGEDGFQGRSLLPLCFEGVSSERALYAMTRGRHLERDGPRPQLMLESGGWRILYRPRADEVQLYRVDSDPQERVDLARELPLRALLIRQSVLMQSAWNRDLLGVGIPRADELDPEDREQLGALGYLN